MVEEQVSDDVTVIEKVVISGREGSFQAVSYHEPEGCTCVEKKPVVRRLFESTGRWTLFTVSVNEFVHYYTVLPLDER